MRRWRLRPRSDGSACQEPMPIDSMVSLPSFGYEGHTEIYPHSMKTPAFHFHSKNRETAWLSNLSAHGFVLEGIRWPSVEHFYQARKYQGTHLEELIRKAETPFAARKAGKNRSLSPRSDWEAVKEAVMREAVGAKFSQNRVLKKSLLATGNAELVHDSKSDAYWGRNAEDGAGENRLGVILMEVRDELAKA